MARISTGTTDIAGREPERQQLQSLLTRALEGQGNLVLIGGEAGIGKTTLVDDLMRQAAARGALVLHGVCYDLELAPPYGIWLDLFRHVTPDGALPAPPPALTDPSGLESLRGSDELYSVVHDYLQDIATHLPLLIVLEDLHWADEASLDLLRTISRQTRPLPVLIAGTYRDVELTPSQPLYGRLPLIVRESRPTRLPLRSLDATAVGDIVRARYEALPSGEADRLVAYLERYAEGNPFYIAELLVMLEYERLLLPEGTGWRLAELTAIQVPPLVRQVVEARLERLSANTREILQVAAVIGVEVPLQLWQTVSGADDEALAATIEEALAAQVLDATTSTEIVRFRHALIHEVLYRTLNLLHRRNLHRRAGEVLASEPRPDPTTVAHHFVQAGDDRAADWLIQAGQRAARAFALSATVANYERALPILERDEARAADRIWLLCALGEAHRFTDAARALDYLNQAVELAVEMNDPALGALANWSHARVRGFRDENVLGDLWRVALAYAALPKAEQDRILRTSLRYVVSEATLSQDLANYGQFAEAERQAREFLSRTSSPASRSEYIEFGNAHFGLALANAALGNPAEALAAFARARAYYKETDNFQMTSNTYYWELNTLLQVYFADDPEERHRVQAEEVQANMGSELVQTSGSADLASTTDTAILDGRWDECRRSASARLHVVASRVPSARKLAELDRLQGNRARAWAHIHSAMPDGPDTAPGRRFFFHRQEIQWIAAHLAMDEGNNALARRWIEAAERWFTWSGRVSYQSIPHLLWSRYHEDQCDLDEASREATRAVELAREPRQPLMLLAAHRALARLDALTGRQSEASEHIHLATELAEACAAPYEIALTQVTQAEVLSHTGPAADAENFLNQALATAERLKAQPLLERINQLAGQLAEAPAAGESAPVTLSARELEVLRAASKGLTDNEIAEELFISPRTVGGHLRSVYTKLGVNSRTSAIASAREAGLL